VRARLTFAAVVLAALVAVPAANAEPIGSHFELTPFGGFTLFDSGLRYPGTSPLTDDIYFGLRFGYHPRSWTGFELATGITPTSESALGGADVNFMHASGNFVFLPWVRRTGGPFFSIGGGAARFTPSNSTPGIEAFNQGTLDLAAGVKLWLTDAVGMRLEARDIMWLRNSGGGDRLHEIVIGGGITLALGGTPRDTDGDGVPDRRDTCPDTPRGAKVDANGCPLDSDGDKVFDGLDQCEGTTKGCTVDAKGCPGDADGDGVCDGMDTCPDTPKGATVDAKGCPSDADGDGVFDGLDKCANTPKGATIDATGCPKDSDGDGVFDGLDKCPDTSPGLKVDATGCPIEVIERETELLDTGMIRLQNVNFETAKADLLPESGPVLDVVGQVLTRWPELKIEIGGHTDFRGSDAYNQKLSDARAHSVLTYLQQHFPALKAEQFTAKGYGEGRPIAPNDTPLNMAKNRRVEFVVLNKDVLKRESERRRLLKASEGVAPESIKPAPAPADTTKK
jgi:OmpA-OmpF porin, OOP family